MYDVPARVPLATEALKLSLSAEQAACLTRLQTFMHRYALWSRLSSSAPRAAASRQGAAHAAATKWDGLSERPAPTARLWWLATSAALSGMTSAATRKNYSLVHAQQEKLRYMALWQCVLRLSPSYRDPNCAVLSAEDHRALLSLEDRLPVNTLALFRLMALRTLVTEFQQKEQREQKERQLQTRGFALPRRARHRRRRRPRRRRVGACRGRRLAPPAAVSQAKMSTVPEEEQKQIFGAVGSFREGVGGDERRAGASIEGRRALAGMARCDRPPDARRRAFMGDWWMNEDDELLGSLTAESADELASQLMSATPDEIAAEADVPSGGSSRGSAATYRSSASRCDRRASARRPRDAPWPRVAACLDPAARRRAEPVHRQVRRRRPRRHLRRRHKPRPLDRRRVGRELVGRHLVCRQRHRRRRALYARVLSVAVEKEKRLASAAARASRWGRCASPPASRPRAHPSGC